MNQNNQPSIITEVIDVQSGETTDFLNINLEMGPNDQFNIWGFFCYIEAGNFNIGDIDNDGADEFTFTDIDDDYLADRAPALIDLPLCCKPRQGMGESLYLHVYRSVKEAFHMNPIPLSVFNNNKNDRDGDDASGRTMLLPFREALVVYPSEQFRLRIENANPAAERNDTYSRVYLHFMGEVIDKKVALQMLTGKA